MIYESKSGEFVQLEEVTSNNCFVLKDKLESALTILWFTEDDNKLKIDGKLEHFSKNDILCVTEFHHIEVVFVNTIKLVRFNRAFHCIVNHDSEVGCKGVLFFGAQSTPFFSVPAHEAEKFDTLWKMFWMEMESPDTLQLEMLQMMLKRYLILCTRLFKETHQKLNGDKKQSDLIRDFNYLVEANFKTARTVTDYAEMLNKSPKTLANVFAKQGFETPLTYIHNRLHLEAKRMIGYSDFSLKEIAYELGFEDIQSFSRFFKRHEGIAPSEFKETIA